MAQRGWPVLFVTIVSVLLLGAAAYATPPQRTPPVTPMPISAPERLVRQIYSLPDPDFGIFQDARRRPGYFTARIVKRAARMDRCYREKYGIAEPHFNMIVPGQDYDIADLRIDLVTQTAQQAEVRVRFNRFRQIDDPVELRYHLKARPEGWRIDDIVYGATSMAKALVEPC